MVSDAQALIAQVESLYAKEAKTIEHMDGLSLSYDDWRFNLRMSNTEPVVRLNVESRGDEALMRSKTQELLAIIDAA
jgi:phosphomannomutase